MQVIEPRLGVVDIAAVAQGVMDAEGGSQVAGGGKGVAPGIVGVADHSCAAAVEDGGYIALQVGGIVVRDRPAGGRIRERCQRAAVIVLVGYGISVFVGLLGHAALIVIGVLYLIPISIVKGGKVVRQLHMSTHFGNKNSQNSKKDHQHQPNTKENQDKAYY